MTSNAPYQYDCKTCGYRCKYYSKNTTMMNLGVCAKCYAKMEKQPLLKKCDTCGEMKAFSKSSKIQYTTCSACRKAINEATEEAKITHYCTLHKLKLKENFCPRCNVANRGGYTREYIVPYEEFLKR